MLWLGELAGVPQGQLPAPVRAEPGGEDPLLAHPHNLAVLHVEWARINNFPRNVLRNKIKLGKKKFHLLLFDLPLKEALFAISTIVKESTKGMYRYQKNLQIFVKEISLTANSPKNATSQDNCKKN
jgi:hypothetical protein